MKKKQVKIVGINVKFVTLLIISFFIYFQLFFFFGFFFNGKFESLTDHWSIIVPSAEPPDHIHLH
ncbi:hypothetical protein HanRHA438_Chr05g0211021 [Helianthus annuus]|nr:hypothetical protein HanRHA438_Chr05g0211021 [Helianthus annuus]